jgi:hypothetical protein
MSNLTPDREAHLQGMQDKFVQMSRQKYEAGQIEHGGLMWEKPGMLEHLKEELVDAWHYVCTLEQQINELKQGVDKSSGQEK